MNATPAPERLPAIAESELTAAQRRVARALIEGPRGRLGGPFIALLRSPELCERSQRLGEYLRYASVVPEKLRELAILAAAQHWRQNYEWQAHAPLAERAGIARTVIEALAADRWPEVLAPDEQTVLAFCQQLHRSHAVSDVLYAQARELLGEDGVVELCALCGYYALLAMVLNVARTAVPAGAQAPFEAAGSK
jgi:4-carboxymuconolactone decarboxylase